MSVRRALLLAALTAGLVPAPSARADKLDKDSKKWLEEVAPVILTDEAKTFRDLKEKGDRAEFQKIFWARRNPKGPEAAENEFKVGYEKARAEANRRFVVAGRPGSATDCGRVLILLGEPNDVKKAKVSESVGPRSGEVWTLKDRPGISFKGGQMEISFDGECQLPQGARLGEQLTRVAEGKIAHPNIGYRMGSDGRLVKLADLLPRPSPVQTLLTEPRQDFPVAAQPKLVMRGKDGATYVGGLVRGESAGLTVSEEGGKKTVPVVIASQATDAAGKVVASSEQETRAELTADGSFLASYSVTLKPGEYTLRVGAFDGKTSKGSVASVPVKATDFNAGELATSDLLVLADIQEGQTPDARDSLSAFFLGNTRLVPRFGNAFSKADGIHLLCWVYNAQTDEAGKASIRAAFAILKDGKAKAKAEDQTFDTSNSVIGLGPVALADFVPGQYVAQIKLTDTIAKKDYVRETPFEVKP